MTEEKIREILPHLCYTKEEVDLLLDDAVAKARAIDELSMKQHNRNATIISMILGFLCLALFVDGLLRILGIIPPSTIFHLIKFSRSKGLISEIRFFFDLRNLFNSNSKKTLPQYIIATRFFVFTKNRT